MSLYPKGSYTRDYKAIHPFSPDTLKLKDVDTPAVNRILQALREDDGDDLRAQSAYNNIKTFLSTAMRMAVGNGLVKVNPVTAAFPLEGKDADTHAYTLEEVHALVKTANNPTMEAVFIVAAFTGMRMEEIKGLRWEDYKNGILEVKRTLVHGVVDGPKSAASDAPVPVVGVVKEALAKHLKQNRVDGDIFRAEYDSQTPAIFETRVGTNREGFLNFQRRLPLVRPVSLAPYFRWCSGQWLRLFIFTFFDFSWRRQKHGFAFRWSAFSLEFSCERSPALKANIVFLAFNFLL